MEPFPTFRANKRYGMYFRNSSEGLLTVRLPDSKTGPLPYGTPATINEALNREYGLPKTTPPSSSPPTLQTRTPLPRSQSSSWWSEIRKSPTPKQVPRSRKTTEATIKTEATMTQPAFESDAFAVHMPTTREPILDTQVSMPTKAQVDAYQTYKRKGQEMREKQRQEGVRVPSKIVSYDYACAKALHDQHDSKVGFDQPSIPAGAYPDSPPQPQNGWAKPAHLTALARSTSEGVRQIPRKPVVTENVKSNSSRIKFCQRADSDAGAAIASNPPKPPTIKARIKPKAHSPEKVQKEPWFGLYNRSPQSSTAGSRSPSPSKVSFAYVSSSDRVFGYRSSDITGTVAGASTTSPTKSPKDKEKSSTSRWAWLRSSPSTKLGKSATSPTKISSPLVIQQKTYIDPFVRHASPTAAEPVVALKMPRPQPSVPVAEKGKFESGWAQVRSLTALLLKIMLILYVIVGLYFLLDAVRDAVHAMGAPFRVMRTVGRCVWVVVVWIGRMLEIVWKKWGSRLRGEIGRDGRVGESRGNVGYRLWV